MKIKTLTIQTVEDMQRLKGFAASFGHKINEKLQAVVLTDENDTWIGYFQLIKTPVFLVGLHPQLSEGRNSIEAIKKMQAWSEMTYGEAIVGVNPGSPFEELLPRLGFHDTNLKLLKSS